MNKHIICFLTILLFTNISHTLYADVTTYTSESEYISALQSLGYTDIHEGFEDDAVWGSVRTPVTASSITSQGVTWQSNNSISGVTTGSGPALTGLWGFYTLPHGDFANGIGDGFVGMSPVAFFGVGGWVETNTPPAHLEIFLNGDTSPVDFGEICTGPEDCTDVLTDLGTQSLFFGVIDTAGIFQFEFLETEGTIGDQKFIFADDFTFAMTPIPEPGAMLLTVFGGLLLLLRRKRK